MWWKRSPSLYRSCPETWRCSHGRSVHSKLPPFQQTQANCYRWQFHETKVGTATLGPMEGEILIEKFPYIIRRRRPRWCSGRRWGDSRVRFISYFVPNMKCRTGIFFRCIAPFVVCSHRCPFIVLYFIYTRREWWVSILKFGIESYAQQWALINAWIVALEGRRHSLLISASVPQWLFSLLHGHHVSILSGILSLSS